MLPFCESGDQYTTPWIDGGFSRCFLQTVGSIASAGALVVLGLTVIVLGPKSNEKPSKYTPERSLKRLFTSKVFLVMTVICNLIALTYLADLVVKGILHIVGDQIYGYTIVEDTLGMVSWIFAILLLYREWIVIVKGKSNGISLALFWILNFIWFGLQLVSINNTKWWWDLSTRSDISDLVLYIIRTVLFLVIFILGFFRPLCCRVQERNYMLLVNVDNGDESDGDKDVDTEKRNKEEQERKEGSFIRQRSNSAFSDFWEKTKLLFPYVWPKGMPVMVIFIMHLKHFFRLLLMIGPWMHVYIRTYKHYHIITSMYKYKRALTSKVSPMSRTHMQVITYSNFVLLSASSSLSLVELSMYMFLSTIKRLSILSLPAPILEVTIPTSLT